jgi:hypothetical protein
MLKDSHEEAYLALREASQVDDAGAGGGTLLKLPPVAKAARTVNNEAVFFYN